MFDFWKKWKKSDPASIWAAVKLIVEIYIVVTTLIHIGRRLLGRNRPTAPTSVDLEAQNRQVMQPNSPRQIGYGDFWVAPKIVAAGNPPFSTKFPYYGTPEYDYPAGGSYRGYSMLLAFTDHPVKFRKLHVNNEDFFTARELVRMNYGKVVSVSPYPTTKDEADFASIQGVETSYTETRQDADERVHEAQAGTAMKHVMVILPKLFGYNFPRGVIGGGADWERIVRDKPTLELHTPDTGAEWRRVSSYILPYLVWNGYTDSHHNLGWRDTVVPEFATRRNSSDPAALGALNVFAAGYASNDPEQRHCFGTSTLEVWLPIGFQHKGAPCWPSPPQFRAHAQRARSTLRLWDDTIPGNPKISTDWTYNNAALCVYDYLVRYTPYGRPVCGFSRIDLKSVAHAAQVCHENGYYANGALNLANSPQDALQQFEFALGGGTLTEQNGIVHVYAGERTLPTYSYDNDEIVENSWSVAPTPSRDDRKGMIDAAYFQFDDGSLQSMATENPEATDALQISQTQFSLINNPAQAAKMAFILNSRSWETETINLRLQAGVPIPAVWDMVHIDLGEFVGISGTYRVMEAIEDPDTNETELVVVSERENLYSISSKVLLAQNNYVPPTQRDTRDGEVNLLIGTNAEGENIYLETREGRLLQLNPPRDDPNAPPPPENIPETITLVPLETQEPEPPSDEDPLAVPPIDYA